MATLPPSTVLHLCLSIILFTRTSFLSFLSLPIVLTSFYLPLRLHLPFLFLDYFTMYPNTPQPEFEQVRTP